MQKQREQGYNKPVLLPCLFMAVIFSAVFALPAWRLAMAYLPMQVTWSQDLNYICPDNNVLSWQVRDFLELNYIRFRSLAYSHHPSIARDLSADYDLDKFVLTLKVSCTEDAIDNMDTEYETEFKGFISDCVKADIVLPGELLQKDSAESRLNKWLEGNKNKLTTLQQRQVDLLMEINACEQELLAVQTRNLVQYAPLQSATEKPSVTVKKPEDIYNLLEKLQARQQELDKQAAYCKDNLLLEQIDFQRDDLFRERQQLLAELDQADSSDSIPKSQNDDNVADIARARENYDFSRYKLDLLKVELADLNSEIAFVEQFLPDNNGIGETGFSPFTTDISDELSVWSGTKKLKLSHKVADIKKTRSLSNLQNLAIGLSGIFGFMLGLVVFRLFSGSEPAVEPQLHESSDSECPDFVGNDLEDDLEDIVLTEDLSDSAEQDDDDFDYSREQLFDRFAGPVDELEDSNEQSSRKKAASMSEDGEAEELDGFASWWVESYDKLAYRLSENRAAMADGLIFSALDKSHLSPRFMINLAISLALKGEKVLVISASQDGVLEKIFSDFSDDFRLNDREQAAGQDGTDNCFTTPGFWNCLEHDLPFSDFVASSPLENLKFLHSGIATGSEVVNNEINNNSDYAEEDSDIDFDCILIYMPELLEGGMRELQKQAKCGPIKRILARFVNIVAVDFIFKPSARKQASISQELARINCRMIDF